MKVTDIVLVKKYFIRLIFNKIVQLISGIQLMGGQGKFIKRGVMLGAGTLSVKKINF